MEQNEEQSTSSSKHSQLVMCILNSESFRHVLNILCLKDTCLPKVVIYSLSLTKCSFIYKNVK